jgi:hypothetical protein
MITSFAMDEINIVIKDETEEWLFV